MAKLAQNLAKYCKCVGGLVLGCIKTKFQILQAFESIFQSLQDVHTFAPLQTQFHSKKAAKKISNFREIKKKILLDLQNFANFLKIQLDHRVDFEKC